MSSKQNRHHLVHRLGFAMAGLLGSLCLALPASAAHLTAVSALAHAPSNVPADYVVTPNGYFPAECVHQAGHGDTVQADGSIRHADGSATHFGVCPRGRFSLKGEFIEPNGRLMPITHTNVSTERATTDSISWDWVEFSETAETGSPAVGYMSATWQVPSNPSSARGQTVYFFPGTQLNTIIQPVLGWNASDDNAWTLSSWNCCVNGQTTNSELIPTQAGHTINGVMQGSDCSGDTCSQWQINTTDANTGQSTTLNATPGQAFNWAFGGVMEVYSISRCTQYPASGSITFSNLVVQDTSQNPITLSLSGSTTTDTPQCGYGVQVSADGSTTKLVWKP